MSERGIMILVVAVLFVGAFLFPYENNDSSYTRPPKPTVPQKPAVGQTADAAGPHQVDVPGSTEVKMTGGLLGPGINAATHRPEPEVILRQVVVAEGQAPSQRDGFPEGQWLEGTWMQISDDPASASPKNITADPASITFHVDGSFTEHMLLSVADVAPNPDKPRADFEGKYRLQRFTLSITRTDRAVDDEPSSVRKASYIACPIAGENTRGLPIRLFIDGKVLKYRD